MRLRTRQLEALSMVAEHGSMTRAAQEMGVSQPAVSRLLADLSSQLGFQLLDKRDGRLVATQEARFLLPDIRRVLERLDRIAEVGRNLTERRAGHLKIACLPGFATSHLPQVLAEFLRARPGVTATIEPDRPERILEWIIGAQYDCAITDSFPGHPAVHSETVPVRTVCIFPEGHALGALEAVGPADLAGLPWVHARRDSAFFADLSEVMAAAGQGIAGLVETRQFTAACELVRRGVGVAVVSELDAAGYRGRGLDWRPFRPEVPHRLALLRPVHATPAMVTLEFLEAFRASLAPFAA